MVPNLILIENRESRRRVPARNPIDIVNHGILNKLPSNGPWAQGGGARARAGQSQGQGQARARGHGARKFHIRLESYI